MSSDVRFTAENIDQYMKALAKAYKKLGGKNTPAEIILIGGAAVLADYGFREATYDIDAIISAGLLPQRLAVHRRVDSHRTGNRRLYAIQRSNAR